MSSERHDELVRLLTLLLNIDLHDPSAFKDRHSRLLELPSVQRRATGDTKTHKVAGLRQLLKDAAQQLEDNVQDALGVRQSLKREPKEPSPALLALYGLRVGTRGKSISEKRRIAAQEYGRGLRQLRRDLPSLLSMLAAEIEMIEDTEERREARDRIERDEPVQPSLVVDWMERFQTYYRIWSSVTGVESDLRIALGMDRSGAEEAACVDRLHVALWHWVEFDLKVERFVLDYGGIWLLSDDTDEERVAIAIEHVRRHPPFNERMASQLRKAGRAADHEYDDFLKIVEASSQLQELTRRWREWVERCGCDLDNPQTDCEVHEFIDDCQVYIELIDRDFDRLVPWYRRKTRVRPFQSQDIIERYGYYGEREPIEERTSHN